MPQSWLPILPIFLKTEEVVKGIMVEEVKALIKEITLKPIEVVDVETEVVEAIPIWVTSLNVNCVANLDTLSMFAITGLIYPFKEARIQVLKPQVIKLV